MATSHSKKTLHLFCQLLQQAEGVTTTQWVYFLSSSDPSEVVMGVDVVALTLSGFQAG